MLATAPVLARCSVHSIPSRGIYQLNRECVQENLLQGARYASRSSLPIRLASGHTVLWRFVLYPEIEPYRTSFLRVSNLHEIYCEESGNPQGKPVIFVHGGPGGGTDRKQRRFFDPSAYRIVLFDQRGCGKSKPHACLTDNTTWHLVADMERIREHLDIQRWQVFGGSWGSILVLAYAEKYPERVTELVLRGIFLLRKQEIDWFYQRGADTIFLEYLGKQDELLVHKPGPHRSEFGRRVLSRVFPH